MKIGYARVSTITQNLDSQIDALKKAGCKKIITEQEEREKVSYTKEYGWTRVSDEKQIKKVKKSIFWNLDTK